MEFQTFSCIVVREEKYEYEQEKYEQENLERDCI
jgi:hypothetical protein